jgi:hypothetical protein
MICLHLALPLDDLLAFGHHPWMIYLHLTLARDDLLAFDIIIG